MGSGRQPTSNTTPASPSAIPASLDSGNGSLSHSAAARAPKNGLVALRIAAVDAAMYCPAKQNNANGSAELTTPMTTKSRQRSRSAGTLPRDSASRRARSAGDILSCGGSRQCRDQSELTASAGKRALVFQQPGLAPQSAAV